MAQLNDAQLLAFFEQYLPNNDTELITPSVLRLVLAQLVESKASLETLAAFAQLASPRFTGTPQVPTAPAGTNSDQVASTAFVQAVLSAIASGKNLGELVVPQDVQGGNWYLTSAGFWEARRSFNAQADPVNGPNWRLLAGFAGQLTTLPVAGLSDATDAGRAMLTAPSAAAQRALVNNPRIAAGQYGNHPGFTTEDGPAGSWAWVIKAILALSSAQSVQQPAAPTAGLVDDTGDTFSLLPNPAYLSFAQYKVAGLPGVTGAVALDATNSYVLGNRIFIKVVGAVNKNGLAVYVAGSGNLPDGVPLTNADPFTGTAVVVTPAPSAALTAALAISVASIVAGNPLTFEVTAGGGSAPYAYAVKATNNATGATTILGSSATGSFTPQAAGVSYNIDATVTDAAGKVAQAVTRTVQVTAAQAVNHLPVASAGDDLAITAPTSSVALMGTASDPDPSDTLTYIWRPIAGPNTPVGLPATTLNVVVSNLVVGMYQFGFQTIDNHGGKSTEDFVVVTVQAAATQAIEVVAFGDSRTATTSRKGYEGNWFEQVLTMSALSTYVGRSNYAVGGAYTVAHAADQNASYIAAQTAEAVGSYRADAPTRWVAAFIGINDIQNRDTQADVRTNFATAINQAKQSGATKILSATLITSNYTGFDATRQASIYNDVLAFNTWLRNNYAAVGVDVLVDVASDKYFGGSDAATNQTYFLADQIHLRPAGSARIAAIAAKGYSLLAQNKTGIVVSDDLYSAPAPGPVQQPVGTSTATFYDDFQRANGAVGNNWVNASFFALADGAAVSQDSFGAGHAPMVRPPSEAGKRQRATATMYWNDSRLTPGLVNRSDGAGNYYMAYFTDEGTSASLNIFRIANYSTVLQLATTVVTPLVIGREYRISFVCYDDQLVASILDTDGSAVAAVRGQDTVYTTGVCGMTADSANVTMLDFQVATV